MTAYELVYISLRFLEHPLYNDIHKVLARITNAETRMLDIGGRTSPQTVGLTCKFTISELPRQTAVQEHLNLGADSKLLEQVRARRSNVKEFIFDDMTRSTLPDRAFDVICAVEVLEHVHEEDRFVSAVVQKLTPGGVFIMTTPNGDYVENNNPDHVRHYTKAGLHELLTRHFKCVDIRYAVIRRPFMHIGYKLERSLKGKLGTVGGGVFYMLSRLQSVLQPPAHRANGTLHLVAQCSNANQHHQ